MSVFPLKTGTLVEFRGSIGIVLSKVEKRGACPTDVWVKWTDDTEPRWENSVLLKVLNEAG